MSKTGQRPDYANECMLVVYVCRSGGPNRHLQVARVMADVGLPWPDPEVTVEEMQDAVFAAKMALLKKLRERKAARKAKR